ncbi:MAG: hypothetical protein ACYC6W_11695 [Nitrosotalea sp.]
MTKQDEKEIADSVDDSFLQADYEVPSKEGNYTRLAEGETKLRILSSPILGWLDWRTGVDGSRKPVRNPMDKPFTMAEIEDPDKVKHFWAMVVWNYTEDRIQIWEITQKGLQKTLRGYAKDADWGNPKNYDVVVTREGKELNTRYQLTPKPAKHLDEGIAQLYKDTPINLMALYKGEDPFMI